MSIDIGDMLEINRFSLPDTEIIAARFSNVFGQCLW